MLILSTIFGSLAFFGIPFITFAFPTRQGEHLATLAAATIAVVSVTISITVLELYKLEESKIWNGLARALVLMHGMPVAISMMILSERYDFYKETIASLIPVSSLGAGVYLNLWLLLLGIS